MDSLKERLDREVEGLPISSEGLANTIALARRRSRNQRIAAGVVGIAVFVAAIWVVTSVSSLDRSGTSVVPGGGVTGPAETGPTEDPFAGWIKGGSAQHNLPPEGAVPSTPVEGTVVDEYDEGFNEFVFVYADGRVISYTGPAPDERIDERRLTPEGVELVRSGAIRPEELLYRDGLPADMWVDPELKPFVPSRYAVCYGHDVRTKTGSAGSPLLRFFPAPARTILLRAETTHLPGWIACSGNNDNQIRAVTTDDARALFEILGGMMSYPIAGLPAGMRIEDSEGVELFWEITMMLPDGRPPPCTGCF